jgi:hypothetical protein
VPFKYEFLQKFCYNYGLTRNATKGIGGQKKDNLGIEGQKKDNLGIG